MSFIRVLPLAAVLACSGSSDDGSPIVTDVEDTDLPVPTADTAPEVPAGPDMVLTDANDYTYDATWTFAEVSVRSSYNVVLSWSGLTTDAWGVSRDASSYDQVLLLETALTPADVAQRLADDDLGGAAVISQWSANASGAAFVSVGSLAYESTPFDPVAFLVADPGKTWLLALADQVGDRLDIRAGAVLVPTDLDPATRAELVDSSSSHTWSASYTGEPLRTAEVHELYTLDWGGLVYDVHGKDYDRFVSDEMFIGHWTTATTDALMADVHDLRPSADAWWTMDIEGVDDARLELARNGVGLNFEGFTAGGTWLIGARCTTCFGPAPLWLTEVEVQ